MNEHDFDDVFAHQITTKRKVFGLLSLAFLVLYLAISISWLGVDPQIPLILGTITATIFAVVDGQKWADLEKGMLHSITMALQAIIILMIIGMLIASWLMGGIVPTMIVYGLDIINPSFFYVTALLLSSIVAVATGSSWTTAGTVGIALMGIATTLNINEAIAAGAIVSGAYFGDKMSPLSDTTNLAPAITGATLFDHIKSMSYTTIPTYILTIIIYTAMGFLITVETADVSSIETLQSAMSELFNITPLLLIPPLLVVAMVVFKIPAIPGLLGATFIGVLAAIILQDALADGMKDGLTNIVTTLHYGFSIDAKDVAALGFDETVSANVSDLLTGGGLDGMMWTVSLILCAMCFGGIMETSGMLHSLVDSLKRFTKKPWTLATTSIFTGIAVNFLASDQYLSIVIPGRMYKNEFKKLNLHPKVHSRILETGGTLTSPLVPWNTCGATMSKFLGVEPTDGLGIPFIAGYAPFAVFNLLNPIVDIIALKIGWAAFKLDEDKEINL